MPRVRFADDTTSQGDATDETDEDVQAHGTKRPSFDLRTEQFDIDDVEAHGSKRPSQDAAESIEQLSDVEAPGARKPRR